MSKKTIFIGDQVSSQRKLHNMSRESLADAMDTSLTTIIRIEQDNRSVYIGEAIELCSIFDVSLSYFIIVPKSSKRKKNGKKK